MTWLSTLALPVMIAGLSLAVVAWGWHAVTEHHVHLILARKVNPDVYVPATRHDARWHGMSHRRRMAVNAALAASAVLLAAAWQLDRGITAMTVLALGIAALAWTGTRALSRAIGERVHHPDPDLEDD